ncbi:MAG: hypothetical protein ACI9GB_001812 [Halioglobus sp.]|jgi:hypothetical protein
MKLETRIFFPLCLLLLSGFSSTVSAGFIGTDGNIWEIRGPRATFSDMVTAAAADTGWQWASQAQWLASGLHPVFLDTSDFIGDTSHFTRRNPAVIIYDAWFKDSDITDKYLDGANGVSWYARDNITGGICDIDSGECNRISYQTAAIPEPTTLALMTLGIAGIGYGRKRKA